MGVMVLWGSCPQGSCPRGSCPRGSCPRTDKNNVNGEHPIEQDGESWGPWYFDLFILFGPCHLKQICKPRSVGYHGHGII